jgi:membrane-associated protease RseP (regulator of RpoE activity)
MIEWVLIFLAVLALFWAFLVLANRRYRLEKRGFAITPGLMMWRTKHGLNFIDRVAGISKGGWRTFGTAAIIVGAVFMVLVFSSLVINAARIIHRPEVVVPGVAILLPGLMPGLAVGPWIIAIASLLVVHELAHGVVMRAQKMRIKSVGGLLLFVIPGAFVEPDEKQLKASPISKRLRVFGAGSSANILFAYVCVSILLFAVAPRPGVIVGVVAENSLADNGGLEPGMLLISINNTEINNPAEFNKFMEGTRPGDLLRVQTDVGQFEITAGLRDNDNVGFLDIRTDRVLNRGDFLKPGMAIFSPGFAVMVGTRPRYYEAGVPWAFVELLAWMAFINFGVGLFNLLPLKPLDGGYIATGFVEKVTSARVAHRVGQVLAVITLTMVIINFAPMFMG